MKNKSENNYPKLHFGSKLNDNYIISLLANGEIYIDDLNNELLIDNHIEFFNNKLIEEE